MAQFARPDSTVVQGGWGALGGPATLWEAIDETVASDSDYARRFSSGSFSNDRFEVGLSNVNDPGSSTDHVLRYRIGKNTTGGQSINLTVELRQGSTIIASFFHSNTDWGVNAIRTFTQTLSTAQADSITDYTDLRFSCSATGNATTPTRSAHCTWAELEVPNAAAVVVTGAADLSGDGALTAIGQGTTGSAADLPGAGTLSSSGLVKTLATASLAGAGDLSATGEAETPFITVTGAAELTGTGAVEAAATLGVSGAAGLAGSSDLVASGYSIVPGTAALTSTSDLEATGLGISTGAAALAGAGTLVASGTRFTPDLQTAVLSGVGSLAAAGRVVVAASATISGTSTLSATYKAPARGAALLQGIGNLSSAARALTTATATATGTGQLGASARAHTTAAADLVATGVLEAVGDAFAPEIITGEALLPGVGVLVAHFVTRPLLRLDHDGQLTIAVDRTSTTAAVDQSPLSVSLDPDELAADLVSAGIHLVEV